MDLLTPVHRRARLLRRHHLAGDAPSLVDAARAVVCLHASDPATVYLSALARCAGADLEDVSEALYVRRDLVRMMGMRRTLFVVPREDVPVVHQAAALDVAATIRKRIIGELGRLPTEPPVPEDIGGWLASVESAVEDALRGRGTASGAELGAAVPGLRTALIPTTDKAYDVRRTLTTQILTLMATEGRLVRSRPLGGWTSRQHTWELGEAWWPDGLPTTPTPQARAELVARYLRAFGPATERDVAWWTGWPLGVTRAALAALDVVDVGSAYVLADDAETDTTEPLSVATLLPALDPTPMGWKDRDWFLPEDSTPLYDRNGNIGPTVWWRGEVVGAWSTSADGRVRVRLGVDRGAEAVRAIDEQVERWTERLGGQPVVPSFPTPWERELRG